MAFFKGKPILPAPRVWLFKTKNSFTRKLRAYSGDWTPGDFPQWEVLRCKFKGHQLCHNWAHEGDTTHQGDTTKERRFVWAFFLEPQTPKSVICAFSWEEHKTGGLEIFKKRETSTFRAFRGVPPFTYLGGFNHPPGRKGALNTKRAFKNTFGRYTPPKGNYFGTRGFFGTTPTLVLNSRLLPHNRGFLWPF